MSTSQRSLFEPRTLPEARAEAAIAIERVEQAADRDWLDIAYEAVERTCREMPTFISDDVWLRNLPTTREDRALGPVLKRAAKDGLCRRTDRVRPSVRSHGSGKPVWESLVFRRGSRWCA
jgi:hypothetical protein